MRLAPTILAALVGLGLPVRSQEPQPAAPLARRGHGDLQSLGLSDDQKQKLREIRKQYAHDPEGRRKALMEVLTPEQREKLKELRRNRREMRRAPEGD